MHVHNCDVHAEMFIIMKLRLSTTLRAHVVETIMSCQKYQHDGEKKSWRDLALASYSHEDLLQACVVQNRKDWRKELCSFTAISPLYKLIWSLHVRIRGNWAESVSTLLKNGAIVRSLGDTGTKMAPSLCWDFKLSNEGSFVEIGQEMTKLGWKV